MDGRQQFFSGSGRSTRRALLGAAMSIGAGAALASSAGLASAQDATPAPAACGLPLGSEVGFVNVEGQEVGTVTVTKIVDPFTGYNPSYPPVRGSRFVLLSVTATNTGTNPWGFDPGRIFIQDSENFLTWPSGVDLGPEPVEPALGYQDIPPATTVSGVVGYVMLKGVAPARIFYQPANDRLILLADVAI